MHVDLYLLCIGCIDARVHAFGLGLVEPSFIGDDVAYLIPWITKSLERFSFLVCGDFAPLGFDVVE